MGGNSIFKCMGIRIIYNRKPPYQMLKKSYFLLGGILAILFILVYMPHFAYEYPLHVDEWKHISEARAINEGTYEGGNKILEIGFQLFLAALYSLINLILIYKFLPALFAIISGAVLFFYMKNLTKKLRETHMH